MGWRWPSRCGYAGALPGVDVTVRPTVYGVKELLSLSSAGAPAGSPGVFGYRLATSPGLTARVEADGGVVFRDVTGGQVFAFAAPWAQDSSGRPEGFTTAVRYALFPVPGSDGGQRLSMVVDRAWLSDPARVFPVVVDPTNVGAAVSQNTYVDQSSPGSSFGTSDTLLVGASGGAARRALLKFDLSSLPRDVDTFSSVVTMESLQDASVPLSVHQVTQPWTEAATWTASGTGGTWTAGGSFGPAGPYPGTTHRTGQRSWFVVTDLLRGWRDGSIPNYGVLIKAADESTAPLLQFASSRSQHDPYLSVNYVQRSGDRPFYSYLRRQVDDRTSLKVNVSSGNLLLANADVGIAGTGVDLAVGRVYNSRGDAPHLDGALPQRWLLGSSGDVTAAEYKDGILYTGPSGENAWFTEVEQPGVNSFISPPGINATMRINPTTYFRELTFHESGQVYTFHYNRMLLSVADRNGNKVTVNYPSFDLGAKASSVTDSRGRTVQLAYNSAGNLESMTDPTGRSWRYGYRTDPNGVQYLNSYTDPSGGVTGYGYADGSGLLNEINDGSGNEIKLVYDGQGRVVELLERDADNSPTGLLTKLRYLSDANGYYTEVQDPRGGVTTYRYDIDDGLVTKVIDQLGRNRSSTYTPSFNVATAVDAMGSAGTAGNTTRYGYDSDNNPASVQLPTGATDTAEYKSSSSCPDGGSNIYLPKCTRSADGNSTTLSYDGPGNLTSSTNSTAGGGAETVSYGYTGCGGKPGQVCTVTDGRGKTTRYSYNILGERTGIDHPAPLGDEGFTYDSLSRLATATDGNGQLTGYSYDLLDRVVQTRYAGASTCTSSDISAGRCITTSYRPDGLPASSTDQSGTSSYGYDPYGRETSRTLPSTGTTSLTYDSAGNTLTATDADGTISYGYDPANQLTSLAEPGGSCTASPTVRCTRFGYDNNGVRTTTTYPTSTPTVLTSAPDNSGRIQRITATTGSTVHSDFAYTYTRMVGTTSTDGALTRTRTESPDNPGAKRTTSYGYDTLARLTSAVEVDNAGGATASWSYGYDPAGNRTSATLSPAGTGAATAFTYNDANQILTRGGVGGFSYDGNGAETAAVGATTRTAGAWNAKRQLTSSAAGGTATAFTYTGAGNKTRLSAGPTSYRNTALGVTAATTNGATTSFIRDPAGTLIAMRTGTSSYYYLFDALGSVVGLVNPTGSKAASYSYDPYGQNRTSTGTLANPYRYTGGLLDAATGLTKLGIRYYDPTLGRFTQPDPTGQDPHYTYAGNNPASFVDPDGDAAFLAPLAAVAIRAAAPSVARFVAGRLGSQAGASNALGRAFGRGIANPSNARYFADRVGSLNSGQIRVGLSVARNTGAARPAIRVRSGPGSHFFLD